MTHQQADPLALQALVRAEIMQPVDPRVKEMAALIAARHADAARAVLFYGSCLWHRKLDGLMLDFYLIVSDYREAFGPGWQAVANRVLPPNVYPFQHGDMGAKYAVLSEADFYRECGPQAGTISVWARFAQPSRLVWARDTAAIEGVIAAIGRASPTLLAYARPMVDEGDALAVWRRGFELTYNCELRAERGGRAADIVGADPERYRRFATAAVAAAEVSVARTEAPRIWRRFRWRGKLITLARLAKASTTFSGGIDYLAWKINRHANTRIELRPWQRRWPLLGALLLLPRLWRQGAIR